MVEQAVGLGLVISLIFSETLGLAAGGMVVPGYVALLFHAGAHGARLLLAPPLHGVGAVLDTGPRRRVCPEAAGGEHHGARRADPRGSEARARDRDRRAQRSGRIDR